MDYVKILSDVKARACEMPGEAKDNLVLTAIVLLHGELRSIRHDGVLARRREWLVWSVLGVLAIAVVGHMV